MFHEPGSAIYVPYRDLNAGGGGSSMFNRVRIRVVTSPGIEKRNISSSAEFDQWPGLEFNYGPQNPAVLIASGTKPNPK